MRLLADENCDRLLVATLREAGHDVVYVAETASGASDADPMRQARAEGRAILTADRDFGLMVERELDRPPAVILMRVDSLGRAGRIKRVTEILQSLSEAPAGELVVIEPAQIRRRPYRR